MKARDFALSLGGNMGDVMSALQVSVDALAADCRISALRVSGVFGTSPWGDVTGGEFLNAAVSGGWAGTDRELLELCRALEAGAGSPMRKEGRARFLDIDILFIAEGRSTAELELPHPRMALRRFVLVPLSQVWEGTVPGLSMSPDELLSHVNDGSSIIFRGTLNGY